jgi:hypothetical protein
MGVAGDSHRYAVVRYNISKSNPLRINPLDPAG